MHHILCISSRRLALISEDESDSDTQDEPSSRPPVPTNLQSANSVNIRPFVRPPVFKTPSAAAASPLKPCRLQVNSGFNDGMLARILTVLEEIKETQRVHGRMMQTHLRQRDAPAVSALPEGTVFPLKTVSDVQNMEQKLADPTFLKEVVSMSESISKKA